MSGGGKGKDDDLFGALNHPMRRQILRRMLEEGSESSPRELSAQLRQPLSALSYHVRVLAECEAIELVRTQRIRGSTQHFYRAALESDWALAALKASEGEGRKRRSPGEEKGRGLS